MHKALEESLMDVHRLNSIYIDAAEHMRYKTTLNFDAATATARLEAAVGKAYANQIGNPRHCQTKQQQDTRQPAGKHKIALECTCCCEKC